MPELAEVFIIARQVADAFDVPFSSDAELELPTDLRVQRQYDSRQLKVIYADKAYDHLVKLAFTLERVSHRGKKIWLRGSGGVLLEVSLGMTGRFSLVPTDHDRVTFAAGDDTFYYSDIRKFGTIKIIKYDVTSIVMPSVSGKEWKKPEWVLAQLQSKGGTVKQALTDQHRAVSGIGNYLVNEVLYQAKVHPSTPVEVLDVQTTDLLLRTARKLVRQSVSLGGCTLRDFRDTLGRPGQFQTRLQIHGKTTCLCGASVQRSGSPSNFVCLRCQPLKQTLTTSANVERTSL